jgi:hypothetical protein
MSHNGKKEHKKTVCHKGTKCHSLGKTQQETVWKYVTKQVKEGEHDVTSDNTSTLRQPGFVKSSLNHIDPWIQEEFTQAELSLDVKRVHSSTVLSGFSREEGITIISSFKNSLSL